MSSEPIPVRVRGPFATSLSKLLHDAGFKLTQPSRVMAERLGLPETDEPAKATVKSVEEQGLDLLIVGTPAAHDRVLEVLRERLALSSFSTSTLEQYSTIVVEVVGEENGRCMAQHRGLRIHLETRACIPGKVTTAYVRRAPTDPESPPLAREGFSILMDTLILFDSGGVSFSKHIYDLERTAYLESLSLKARQRGLGIRWRSNAARAPRELVERELEQALAKAEELMSPLAASSLTPGEVLTRGNRITLSTLSLPDKRLLDDIRSDIVPTISHHHSVKTAGPMLDKIVSYSEYLVEKGGLDPGALGRLAWSYAWELLAGSARLTIYHATPEARVARMGPARVKQVDGSGRSLVLERLVKQDGVYDGLGVEKRRGDRILTAVLDGAWGLIHAYLDNDGNVKGLYFNINTPPEPGEGFLRYLDLHIDVVHVPGRGAEVIDRDKLETALAGNRVGEKLYRRALEAAERAHNALSNLGDLTADEGELVDKMLALLREVAG